MTRDRAQESSQRAGDLGGRCKNAGMHCAVFLGCAWKKENGSTSLWFPSTVLAVGMAATRSAVKTTQMTEAFEVETLLAIDQKVKCINKHYSRSQLSPTNARHDRPEEFMRLLY